MTDGLLKRLHHHLINNINQLYTMIGQEYTLLIMVNHESIHAYEIPLARASFEDLLTLQMYLSGMFVQ